MICAKCGIQFQSFDGGRVCGDCDEPPAPTMSEEEITEQEAEYNETNYSGL